MNRCPITYEPVQTGRYSSRGLARLARGLTELLPLPYTAAQQREEAARRADKMSIQGVQPKLSAVLTVSRRCFEIVDRGGRFILKPPHPTFPSVPENEDLTMKLAAVSGIEVPLHGLVYGADDTLTYFVKRFDRLGRGRKVAVEDFAQLDGRYRETKYQSSMEQVARIVERYCTFPLVEKTKLLRLVLFNFLVGNEDHHLKNFSVITKNDVVGLSPAYDLVNTTLVLKRKPDEVEEIALPLKGRKRKLSRSLFLRYFAGERLGLNDKTIESICSALSPHLQDWPAWIERSFLPEPERRAYAELLAGRRQVLGL